jgi:hypothetical protein
MPMSLIRYIPVHPVHTGSSGTYLYTLLPSPWEHRPAGSMTKVISLGPHDLG